MGVRVCNNKFVVVFLVTMMITIMTLFRTTDARPQGPAVNDPQYSSLCMDMTPQHGGRPQTSSPPYTIATSTTCYTPDQATTGNII